MAITFAVTAGALPAGLTLTSAGLLSGTPTTAATSNFTITATDSVGATGSRAYTLVINATLSAISPSTLPFSAWTKDRAITSVSFSVTGGTAPIVWDISAGTLPSGLTLSSAGVLSGTPTSSGPFPETFNFTVRATDANNDDSTQAYSFQLNDVISLTPTTLPSGTQGVAYSQQISANGGTP